MTPLFAGALITHVVMGITGVIASYAVVMFLLKKEVSIPKLKLASSVAFLSYMLSWFSGGYYYVLYYGGNVKPIIKEGVYPWAHLVVMEAKEHIFLVLPFATLAVAVIAFLGGKELNSNPRFKNTVLLLAIIVSVLATAITLAGIIISGGAR